MEKVAGVNALNKNIPVVYVDDLEDTGPLYEALTFQRLTFLVD
jgi:hypothetical protein